MIITYFKSYRDFICHLSIMGSYSEQLLRNYTRKYLSVYGDIVILNEQQIFIHSTGQVMLLEPKSCRDCLNLEDRRQIEGVALCAMRHGPSVSCQEFNPKTTIHPDSSYEQFCVNCVNFECIKGVPMCSRDHRPGTACGAFRSKN